MIGEMIHLEMPMMKTTRTTEIDVLGSRRGVTLNGNRGGHRRGIRGMKVNSKVIKEIGAHHLGLHRDHTGRASDRERGVR